MTVIESRIRPSRAWFAAGAGIIVLGIVGGIVLMVTGVVSAVGKLPEFTTEIEPGTRQSVELDRAGEWGLFAGRPGVGSGAGKCMIRPTDAGTVTSDEPSATLSFERSSRQWEWLATFKIDRPGTYQFECTGTGDVDRFAVGEKPDIKGFAGRLVGGIVALLATPCVGFVVGLVIIIVTAARRSSARKKLQVAGYQA